MEAPKLDKIVINIGCGDATNNSKLLEAAIRDLEVITDIEDTLQEEVSYTSNVKKDVHKERDEIEQIEKKDKQILSVEQNKKFSLKDAVIYSTILERPYK